MSDWRITLADLLASRGRMLKRYAYLLCGDPEEADDLVQEALFKVMTRKGTDELQSTEAYLKRVITNEYFDRARPGGLGCGTCPEWPRRRRWATGPRTRLGAMTFGLRYSPCHRGSEPVSC